MTKARTLADNFAADINAITAGTGITGGGTSGTVTVTNSMATAIDAKGDLVVGTGADTFSRLAVASTAGYLLSVDSAEATGLKWAAPASATFIGCSVYNSAGQSLANETLVALTWDSELYDTDAIHSTATNTSRFTVPSGLGGKWLLNVHIGWVSGNAGYRGLRPRINGTDNGFVYNYTAGTGISTEYSLVYNLSAADYIEIMGDQSSGGSLSTGGTGATASRVTFTKVG